MKVFMFMNIESCNKIKTIGLIGGMSWQSSLEYYKNINEKIQSELGGLHSAKLIISSIDFYELENAQRSGDWDMAEEIIFKEALKLKNAGADFLVICSNTGNKAVPNIEKRINIPILHIADAIGNEAQELNLKNLILLGTRHTMQEDYVSKILRKKYELDIIIPAEKDIFQINDIIYKEICLNILSEKSRNVLKHIIKKIQTEKNADGIILGCTELPLLLREEDLDMPILDSGKLHAIHAANFSLHRCI